MLVMRASMLTSVQPGQAAAVQAVLPPQRQTLPSTSSWNSVLPAATIWLDRVFASISRSMSRKGCSPDNAACEDFFGRLKTELFYPRQWQATTLEQFMQLLDSYIRWYNEKRIKLSLGSLSPIEYRESLGIAA